MDTIGPEGDLKEEEMASHEDRKQKNARYRPQCGL